MGREVVHAGYRYDGMKFGSKDNHEGQIYLNPQAWAIIAGAATPEQAESFHENGERNAGHGIWHCLVQSTLYVIRFYHRSCPAYESRHQGNGGIFVHTQGWAVMAETLLGHGNRAYDYLKSYLPSSFNDKAEIREIEPYVVCQSTHSNYSPGFGKSRIPWLSGSATWTYYAITQFMLGIRPGYNGIAIDPCIPSNWNGFRVYRKFRAKC